MEYPLSPDQPCGPSLSGPEGARCSHPRSRLPGRAGRAMAEQAIFDPINAKYFTPEEKAKLSKRKFDQEDVTRRWDAFILGGQSVDEKGRSRFAGSPRLARRWNALASVPGGDQAIAGKARAVWGKAMADPKAAKLPLKSGNLRIRQPSGSNSRNAADFAQKRRAPLPPAPCPRHIPDMEKCKPSRTSSRFLRSCGGCAPGRLPVGPRANLRDHRALHHRGSL